MGKYAYGYEQQFLIVKEEYVINKDIDSYYLVACDVMFTQMTTKKGIKLFGERAVTVMFKEYKELDKRTMPGKLVFGPISYDSLSRIEISEALEAVHLTKEKREGKIKECTCTNRSK